MFAEKWRYEPSVIQRLLDTPHRFQFFQAVRVLEIWLKKNSAADDSAIADYLRFKNRLSLSFPASEIEALSVSPKGLVKTDTDLLEALQTDALDHISLTPAFMGFLGGNGALPFHYTERIAGHQLHEKDEGPRAFLDTFSNRSLALFYESWKKYRLEYKYQLSGEDRFLPLLLSLAGLGHGSVEEREVDEESGVLYESIAYYAAAFRNRPASAPLIERVISDYFGVKTKLEQFIGRWYKVPQDQQCALGAVNSTLGREAMMGERVWQRDLRMRLVIGPLRHSVFEGFLPGGKSAKALEKLLTMFTNTSIEYEVQLLLRKEDVVASQATEKFGGRLGLDSFLISQRAAHDRIDVRYEIHALPMHG